MRQLEEVGPAAAVMLARSLGGEEGSAPGIRWQEDLLDVLTLMGRDAGDAFWELGDAMDRVPDDLVPKCLRAWGEVGYWAVGDVSGVISIATAGGGKMRFTVQFPGNRNGTIALPQHDKAVEADLTRAFARLGVQRDLSLDQAMALLDSRNLPEVEVGVDVVATYGKEAREALVKLHSVVETEQPLPYADFVRFKAARAMIALAPDDPETSMAHAYMAAHHHDPEVRARSALAAAQHPDRAGGCAPFLTEALSDPDPRVVREAVTALGILGPGARAAIPALEALTGHGDPQIDARAKAALRQIRPPGGLAGALTSGSVRAPWSPATGA